MRKKFTNVGYEGYCQYFEQRYKEHTYGFTRKPLVKIGGVDIASVFIDRNKFSENNVFFSKFCPFVTLAGLALMIFMFIFFF